MATSSLRPDEVSRAVARIQAGVLAVVCALLGGAGLFLMTIWLVIKGGPNVGQHLQLLDHRKDLQFDRHTAPPSTGN